MSETTTMVQNPTGFGERLSHIDRINGVDNVAAVPGIGASAGRPFHLAEDAFDMMTDEQNERLLTALESIADSMGKSLALIAPQRTVPTVALQPPKPPEAAAHASEAPHPAPAVAAGNPGTPAAPSLHPVG